VGHTSDLFGALDLQEEIQRKYTGGTVFHSFLGESIENVEACKKLVKKIAENYRIPYYTISPTFSVCSDHGYLKGEQSPCPSCGKETEVYARIVGYYRPVKNWNKGKAEEYVERMLFEPHSSGNVVTLLGADRSVGQEERGSTGKEEAASPKSDVRTVPVLELNSFIEKRVHRVNGSSDWKLFTKPNCSKCDEVKENLGTLDFRVEILDLQDTTGRKLFTRFYRQIRDKITRKDSGEMNLPVLLNVGGDGQILKWAMGPEEISEVLQGQESCHPC
jgi:glutaredoxin